MFCITIISVNSFVTTIHKALITARELPGPLRSPPAPAEPPETLPHLVGVPGPLAVDQWQSVPLGNVINESIKYNNKNN